MKKRIGVIFGGRSGEHEISIRSAKTVIEKLNKEKYDVMPMAISKNGKWLSPAESLTLLPETSQTVLNETSVDFPETEVALIGDTQYKGLTKISSGNEVEKTFPLD